MPAIVQLLVGASLKLSKTKWCSYFFENDDDLEPFNWYFGVTCIPRMERKNVSVDVDCILSPCEFYKILFMLLIFNEYVEIGC